MMAGFTRALGVRCTFCHVGEESQPLGAYDFASDEKLSKRKARTMLEMVNAINSRHLTGLEERTNPPLEVRCATCHRGVREPRPLADLLVADFRAGGLDSVLAHYRALRDRYYGSAAYDFGEVTLTDVANVVDRDGHLPEALRLHALNVEMNPSSAFAQRMHAEFSIDVALRDGGRDAGLAEYRRLRSQYPPEAFPEFMLNELGYRLMRRRPADAVVVLRWNVEAFPKSSNVYDSLGEGLLAAGDTAEAVKQYRKVLELDPGNQRVVNLLNMIGKH
jgi:tetratricopeptide (TPR) repeat protein